MSFSLPIQWFHSHEDPIWPVGTFKSKWLGFMLVMFLFLFLFKNLVVTKSWKKVYVFLLSEQRFGFSN
jgi:hypothetical protein